jgi:hypothetical protein
LDKVVKIFCLSDANEDNVKNKVLIFIMIRLD